MKKTISAKLSFQHAADEKYTIYWRARSESETRRLPVLRANDITKNRIHQSQGIQLSHKILFLEEDGSQNIFR